MCLKTQATQTCLAEDPQFSVFRWCVASESIQKFYGNASLCAFQDLERYSSLGAHDSCISGKPNHKVDKTSHFWRETK